VTRWLPATLLTLATFLQLADLYTWKLLLGRIWVEDGYLYRAVELNPIVNSYPPGGGELLKLAMIVFLLSFSSLSAATKRFGILPQIIALILIVTGLVGTLSNIRAIQ